MSRIRPNSYLPIANKTNRTAVEFYLDAILNMSVAQVITEQEAAVLMDKVEAWEKAANEQSRADTRGETA